jgi:TPR repeat protein
MHLCYGFMYYSCKGVAKDVVEAENLYQLAANQGNAHAQQVRA